MRYRVPDGYLEEGVEMVRMLIDQIEAAGKDQTAIDEVYGKLLIGDDEREVGGSEGKEKGGGANMVYK